VYAPIYCRSGVAAFGRDIESSKQVWSSIEGYPGDYNYRDFYRDVGFDLDYDYIRPYIHPDGVRVNLGIKYYKITGTSNHNDPYIRHWALEKAAANAGNILFHREKQVEWLGHPQGQEADHRGAYDAELYGTGGLRTGLDQLPSPEGRLDQKTVRLTTPLEYLAENRCQMLRPRHRAGVQRLCRGMARRLERLDLPPFAQGSGPHGRARAGCRRAVAAQA
jgi:1,4-alpha-glucan branching enzyme